MKEKGVIPDKLRNLMCDLVALHNVPASQCIDAFKCIATGLGFEIDGNISTRSVNRIMKEGGIAAKVHIIESFQKAEGIALSSDGTSHKNNNYESHCATTVDSDGRRREFFLGISMAANHTSETQRDGWIELVDELYKLFLASPFHNEEQDVRNFWASVTGMHTDHAADQKKLFELLRDFKQRLERERRGERILLQMESTDLVPLLFRISQEAVDRAGGIPAWERLSETEQKSLHQEMYLQAVTEIGEADFEKLSPEEKGSVDLFLWAGCCMHKDMNAFKGAVTAMEAWWGENGVDPPVLLPNRDNDAAASLAPGTAAAKRATEKSKGGGVKVSTLAGAVFRHKDRKRGQQDTLRFCFDKELGFSIEFPDTNNTRFQSHAQACAVLITYLDFFLSFLDLVEDNKSSRSLNHMEENVRRGLRCNKTLHEIAAITLYHQAISVPYMREIRGPASSEQNVLKLRHFHQNLKAHLRKLIATPELIISPDISFELASFDGKPWDRPDAIYAVQYRLPTLPHLKPLFVALCRGALQTWERFTDEWAEDSPIMSASAGDIDRASMKKTNDKNESEFGILRRDARDKPSMSVPQHNARQMYKQNEGSGERMQLMSVSERRFIRKAARAEDGSGQNKATRHSIAEHMKGVADGKRERDRVRSEKEREAQARIN
ncbi:hypothetical protein F5880DRAFT_1491626 [Lentinula raphanica]|nr:hypothetical protein F5880DRAFT_1491626 [Lentinula raphanica]